MKKILLLTVLAALSLPIMAQLGVGLKGGASNFALTGEDKSYIYLYHFGGLVQIRFSNNFSVQPELLYSKQGNGYEENDVKIRNLLDYVNIPVMIQFNTKSGFTFEAGPELGFLLGAKNKIGDQTPTDIKSGFKSTNLSFGLGLLYRMKMGLGFGMRYNIGLSNLSVQSTPETKSTGAYMGISYIFFAERKKK